MPVLCILGHDSEQTGLIVVSWKSVPMHEKRLLCIIFSHQDMEPGVSSLLYLVYYVLWLCLRERLWATLPLQNLIPLHSNTPLQHSTPTFHSNTPLHRMHSANERRLEGTVFGIKSNAWECFQYGNLTNLFGFKHIQCRYRRLLLCWLHISRY